MGNETSTPLENTGGDTKDTIPEQPTVVRRSPSQRSQELIEEGDGMLYSNTSVSRSREHLEEDQGVIVVSEGQDKRKSKRIDPDLSALQSLPQFSPLISSSADLPFAWKEIFSASDARNNLDSFNPLYVQQMAELLQNKMRHDASDISLRQRAITMKMKQIDQSNRHVVTVLAGSNNTLRDFAEEQSTLSRINNELGMIVGHVERAMDLIDDIQKCLPKSERLEDFPSAAAASPSTKD